MTPNRHAFLAATLALAAASASFTANAAVQWSFDIGGCNPDAATQGNTCTFEPVASTIPPGDTAIAASVTAWANTGAGGGLQTAVMRDWGSSGAGVQYVLNGVKETSTSPQHAMDNEGQLEFMLFDFQGQEVQLTDLTLGWETDSDLSVLAYVGAGAPNLSGDFITNAGGQNLTGAGGWVSVAQIANADYYFDFSSSSAGITSSYWLVGAYAQAFGPCNTGSGGCGQGQDHVKLWDVGGIISNTPPPPSSTPGPAPGLLVAGGLLPLLRMRRR